MLGSPKLSFRWRIARFIERGDILRIFLSQEIQIREDESIQSFWKGFISLILRLSKPLLQATAWRNTWNLWTHRELNPEKRTWICKEQSGEIYTFLSSSSDRFKARSCQIVQKIETSNYSQLQSKLKNNTFGYNFVEVKCCLILFVFKCCNCCFFYFQTIFFIKMNFVAF